MSQPHPIPVVLGTAGHIDHGKSALIAALCGSHPDRLQEEKARGMTISLGYGEMQLAGGTEVGFVDVPGHEKLVRKMVAGATGMSAALLVVACNDGIMQQTREHFEVLTMLGVKPGLIVLSKCDLADAETIELVQLEVEELVEGTAWQDCPRLIVSTHTEQGIDDLRTAVVDLAHRVSSSTPSRHGFILHVQRSFAVEGAGTVVTGVCASGSLAIGDSVCLMPLGKQSRVRRIHVHGKSADVAVPGLRTALNLPDLTKQQCEAGNVIVEESIANSGKLLRVAIHFSDSQNLPKPGSEVHVMAGTAAIHAKLFCYAQRRGNYVLADVVANEDVFLAHGQRCLLRRPSPAANYGSLRFLGFADYKLRARDTQELNWWLEQIDCLDDEQRLLLHLLNKNSAQAQTVEQLCRQLSFAQAPLRELLQQMVDSKDVRATSSESYVAVGEVQGVLDELQATVQHYCAKNPNRLRIPLTLLRQRVGKKTWPVVESLTEEMLAQVDLKLSKGEHWLLLNVKVEEAFSKAAQHLAALIAEYKLQPPAFHEVWQQNSSSNAEQQAMYDYLLDSELCIAPQNDMLFASSVVSQLAADVVTQLQAGGMDIPALRDKYSTSRKFLMPLLEYFDTRGLTERVGAKRVLRNARASLRD
ncbi:MAG: selenocysteine-specific translation elongation factor [Planctomycetes bacterium]|nr:selenocysteine-specific translation elongation factor [Planctomycetota bacterium]